MNRREFMACALVLTVNPSIANMHMHDMNHEQRSYIASAANFNDWQGTFFNAQQKAMVKIIAEIIIPQTKDSKGNISPGAIDAGIHRFIERMAQEWFTLQEQAIFIDGLKQLEQLSQAQFKQPFIELANSKQTDLLEQLEEAASDHPWYEYGNVFGEYMSDAPFICHIKELTVWGFFTSEQGGNKVLRNSVMTTEFKGDIPLKPDDSSWNYLQF